MFDNDIFSKVENLNADLIPYLEKGSARNFAMLRHPLVYSVPYSPAMNAYINKQYEVKSKALKDYLSARKFDSYIFLHERAHRLMAYFNIRYDITDLKVKGDIVNSIWTDSENIWQNLKVWKVVLKEKGVKENFMSEEDKAFFNSLPDQITIYRGHQSKNAKGLSYTLDKDKALWFANRFKGNGTVKEIIIDKKKVFAYTNERDEKEIIVL